MSVEVQTNIHPQAGVRVLDISARLRRSAALFGELVWPHVSAVFGPGRLAQVEAIEVDCARALDLLGIDYLFIPAAGEAFGVAARVQAPDRSGRPWDSFTMSSSPYQRLRSAEDSAFGRLLPAVAVHAFVGGTDLLSVGVARVRDLVITAPTGTHLGPSGSFHAWSFDDLRAAGRLIARFPDPCICNPFSARAVVPTPR